MNKIFKFRKQQGKLIMLFFLLFTLYNYAQNIDKIAEKCNNGNVKACEKLVDIAKNTKKNLAVRKAAIEKLTDQTILADIVKNTSSFYSSSSDIRKAAIEKLTDQTLLADIAKNANSSNIQKAAIEKLTDQTILADIVENTFSLDVRKAAIEKLTDQTLLADIAKNTKGLWAVRKAAIEKLTDQTILADIAKNTKEFWAARTAAIEKLTDQTILADIVKKTYSSDISKATIEKLTDQTILADIAKNANSLNVRKAAIEKLTDQTEKLTDQTLLADIAKNTKGLWAVRKAAIEKLTDQTILADIAINEKDSDVREAAVVKLTDKTILKELMSQSITSISIRLSKQPQPFIGAISFSFNSLDSNDLSYITSEHSSFSIKKKEPPSGSYYVLVSIDLEPKLNGSFKLYMEHPNGSSARHYIYHDTVYRETGAMKAVITKDDKQLKWLWVISEDYIQGSKIHINNKEYVLSEYRN